MDQRADLAVRVARVGHLVRVRDRVGQLVRYWLGSPIPKPIARVGDLVRVRDRVGHLVRYW